MNDYHYLSSNGDVAKTFFIPQVFEGGNHVGLEVVPTEAELLVISHGEIMLQIEYL